MSLKPKNSRISDQTSINGLVLEIGPWGRINPSRGCVEVIRFCQRPFPNNEKTHSYPYRVLTSWHWSRVGEEEELCIHASADQIVIKGRGLDRLVEALESGSLEMLSEPAGENVDISESRVQIISITILRSSEQSRRVSEST